VAGKAKIRGLCTALRNNWLC